MMDREFRLRQAQHRLELRQLEVEIESLRHEQRFYRRMGFGHDLQDMQMAELLEKKRECERQLQHIAQRMERRRASGVSWLSWLMLSPLVLAMGCRSLLDRRLRSSEAS